MPYTTVTKVRQALAPDGTDQANPQTNYQGTAATLGDNAIRDCIAQAQQTIEGMIGARYDVPVPFTVPDVQEDILLPPGPVPYWARDIAAYYASLVFRRNQPMEANDPMQLRFNIAMVALAAVRDGKAIIPGLIPSTLTNQVGVAVAINPYEGCLFPPSSVLTPTFGEPWPASQRPGPYLW